MDDPYDQQQLIPIPFLIYVSDNPWLNPHAREGLRHERGEAEPGVGDGEDIEGIIRNLEDQMGRGEFAHEAPPPQPGNLDPTMNPLLLFFQSLLPWNRL